MTARCPRHNCVINFATIEGRLIEWCEKCERRARGECIDGCGAPTGRRWRCPRCETTHRNKAANLRRWRICRLKGCKVAVTAGSKRQYCCDDHQRRAKNAAYVKRYWANPKFRAHRLKTKAVWRASKAGTASYLKGKRKGRLSGTWGYSSRAKYLETMRRHNEKPKRIERRRELASAAWLRARTGLFDEENRPLCAVCLDVVPWDGRGRPRKYCPPCHPWRKS